MTEIHPIAHFRSPFGSKFGIPKQSGLVKNVPGHIVFEPAYRSKDALRGIDKFVLPSLVEMPKWVYLPRVLPSVQMV